MAESHGALESACQPAKAVLARIGERWSVLVVIALRDGSLRYAEVKRALAGVSQRMLTLTLRSLERDGLVSRTVVSSKPLRVDYELTPLGHSLRRPMEELAAWARDHEPQISRHQAAFDGRRD
jgi:DNA-binding HxlR family transcriptional regulator